MVECMPLAGLLAQLPFWKVCRHIPRYTTTTAEHAPVGNAAVHADFVTQFNLCAAVRSLACNTARAAGKNRTNFADGADEVLALLAQHATAAM